MSEHLPECGYGIELSFDGVIQPAEPCICDRLRACEARVLLSKPNIELSAVYGYEAGRADGLSAARDAVAALEPLLDKTKREGGYDCCGCKTPNYLYGDALAAIDALRGDA